MVAFAARLKPCPYYKTVTNRVFAAAFEPRVDYQRSSRTAEAVPVRSGATVNKAFYNLHLSNYAGVFGGPVDKDGFAVDELAGDGAEVAAVRGDGAVVSHHEVVIGRYGDFVIGTIVTVLSGDVRFADGKTVDVDVPADDAEAVSGQADDPLDVAFFFVSGVAEDDDVAAVDSLQVIDKFIDKEAVVVFEPGQHAGAFDADGLVEKGDDENGSEGREDKVAQPEAQRSRSLRRPRRRRRRPFGDGAGAWA